MARMGCLALALAGCASTQFEIKGDAPTAAICQAPGQALSALVLWGPVWRPDQKDVPQREEAARQGLQHFLGTAGCFASYELRRLPGGGASVVPGDAELRALAAATRPPPDRVLVVTVRELGPVLKLQSAVPLVEGGTEVVLDLVALDAGRGTSIARFQARWRNGGTMVVKGVSSLPQDMSAAMSAATSSAPRAP